MEQWEEAQKASATATDSAGSAYRENEKYLESYEARLNRMQNAWTEAIIAMRDSALGDGIVVVTGLIEGLSKGITSIVDQFGLLPSVFGVATVGLLTFGDSFRDLVLEGGKRFSTLVAQIRMESSLLSSSMNQATVSSRALNTALVTKTATANILTVSLRALRTAFMTTILPMAASIAIFAAIGWGISKLIEKISKAKQEAEELERENDRLNRSFSDNEDRIRSLANEYKNLSEQVSSGEISENDTRYLEVQQELHELLPSLTDRIDEKGQAHLKSSEAIQKEIETMEELNRLDATKFVEEFSDHVKEISKEIDKVASEIKKLENNRPSNTRLPDHTYATTEPNKLSSEDQIKKILLMREEQARIEDLKQAYINLAQAYSIQLGHKDALTKADEEYILALIESNREQLNTTKGMEELGETVKDVANKISLVRSVVGDLYTAEEIELMDSKQIALFDVLSDALKQSEADWEAYRERIEKVTGSSIEADKIIKTLTESQIENATVVVGMIPDYDELGNVIGYVEDEVNDLKTAHESLTEAFNNSISSIERLNSVLEELDKGEGLSAKSIGVLLDKYPHLLAYMGDEVTLRREIQKEIKKQESLAKQSLVNQLKDNEVFFKNLLNANKQHFSNLEKLYKVDFSNAKTLAQAKENIETQLLRNLGNKWSQYYDAQTNSLTKQGALLVRTSGQTMGASVNPFLREYYTALADARRAKESLDKLAYSSSNLNNINLSLSGLSNSTSKASKSASGLSKDYEHSTYVSDKFKQALEKLNLELEKQNAIQAKFPKHSKEYRRSLDKELSLLQQKKKLLEDQAKALDKQIKSGKIQQKGIVTTSSKTTSPSKSVADYYLKNFRITSNFGDTRGRSSPHKGVDFANGKQGDLVKAVNSGKVITATYSKSAGYWVVVQQDDGTVAKYMHMQKGLNVKAGQRVSAGQTLGKVGNTGQSTGAHLHFQVEKGGKAIDPVKYLKSAQSTVASTSKAVAQNKQNIDQAKSELLSLQKDVLVAQADIDRLNYEIVESNLAYYENLIDGVGRSIAKTQHQAKLELSTSDAYREKLEEESKHLKYKQDLLHKQANYIREELKNDKLSAAYKDELRAKLSDLGLAWWDLAEAIRDVNFAILESNVQHYASHLDGVDRTLQKINLMLSVMEEGTGEYTSMLSDQIKHYEYKHSLLHKEIQYLEEQLRIGGYSKDQVTEINKILSDKKLQWWEVENAIKDINKRLEEQKDIISDDIIKALKDAYAKKRDIELKYIDERMKNLEDTHKRQMEMYDEDLARYEDIVRKKLELIDDQASEEDFQEELRLLRKEEIELQKQINELSLDDSYWAKAERVRLEEELVKQREKINKLQTKRERELRKKNLNQQLEDFQKETEEKKKTETEKYEAEKERLEQTRKDIEYTYNEILANERKWAKIREDIIKGNISNIQLSIDEFLDYFVNVNEQAAKQIGESYQDILNIMDRLTKGTANIQDSVKTEGSYFKQTIERMKDNSNRYNATQNWDERVQLKQENQRLGESVGATFIHGEGVWVKDGQRLFYADYEIPVIEKMKENSAKWSSASPSERKKLEEENQRLGKSINATYNSSIGRWFKGGVPLYHDGGIIGNKGSKLANYLNKLANLKPNEQLIKGLKGEVMIPEKNIPNLFGNLGKMLSPNINMPRELAGVGDTVVIFEVDKMYANKNEAEEFGKMIIEDLKRNKGGRY